MATYRCMGGCSVGVLQDQHLRNRSRRRNHAAVDFHSPCHVQRTFVCRLVLDASPSIVLKAARSGSGTEALLYQSPNPLEGLGPRCRAVFKDVGSGLEWLLLDEAGPSVFEPRNP